MSNLSWYKYDWVWKKEKGSGFLNANKQPLRNTENILVFSHKQSYYNPQMSKGNPYIIANLPQRAKGLHSSYQPVVTSNSGERFPQQVLEFKKAVGLHPTQKPVPLLEYLIKTYADENMLVLDNCMGSGSTGVACKNLNRKFIGIELDEDYFNIAKERING